jgi:uridine kinase
VSEAARRILAAIDGWRAARPAPLVVAIDGHGAAGKTTIAGEVAAATRALVVHTDDYFHPAQGGDPRPMAQYYAWDALRAEAIEPAIERLRTGPAAGSGSGGLVLVEGVSSACPALCDLVAQTVFVATPEALRLERLRGRITEEDWDAVWLEAERVYFANRPPESFDLIVPGDR